MKRWLSVLLIVAMTFSFVACAAGGSGSQTVSSQEQTEGLAADQSTDLQSTDSEGETTFSITDELEKSKVQDTAEPETSLSQPSTSESKTASSQQVVEADTSSNEQVTSAPETSNNITVYITKTGSKYHRDGCQYLSKSQIAISLSDAKSEGYTPCSKCNPPR